jgi:transposase
MLTVTTRRAEEAMSARASALYLSFELGEREWKLAFTLGLGHRPRHRTVRARDFAQVLAEIAAAQAHWALAPTTVVRSCYEAGRDGFWLHRALTAHGVANVVVDAASIEVNRRLRRAKADRLDNEKLGEMLQRYHAGERWVWHVVRVPSEADEDRRHLERERTTLVQEQTRLRNRLQGLLANHGVSVPLRGDVGAALRGVRRWDGSPLPPRCLQRCEQEWARLTTVAAALATLATERHTALGGADAVARCGQRLAQLRAVGATIAWTWATELFAWRDFRNGREVGSLLGLTPTPSQSGATHRELGIAKHGNPRLRALAVEAAWFWLRYQPQSALSQWYQTRFGGGSPRLRRIGIVALARKLVIALWRWVTFHELPEGAVLKPA